MNITMKLTFDGLVRALRFKGLALREDAALRRRDTTGGNQHDERRGSIAEGPVRGAQE